MQLSQEKNVPIPPYFQLKTIFYHAGCLLLSRISVYFKSGQLDKTASLLVNGRANVTLQAIGCSESFLTLTSLALISEGFLHFHCIPNNNFCYFMNKKKLRYLYNTHKATHFFFFIDSLYIHIYVYSEPG